MIENPKTKDSGILCAIPQRGQCPLNCPDCFYNSGRGYLEPLEENTPNLPLYRESVGRVIRLNDGNDSNVQRDKVIRTAQIYAHKFYNTSIPKDLGGFDAPVVLTVNPGEMIDRDFHKIESPPDNLMFVRVLVNTWNVELVDEVVLYYTGRDVPVVLTFMAYLTQPIPEDHQQNYVWRVRVQNPYFCIKRKARERIVDRYALNKRVDVCGHRSIDCHCQYCGNCLKYYFATLERKIKK